MDFSKGKRGVYYDRAKNGIRTFVVSDAEDARRADMDKVLTEPRREPNVEAGSYIENDPAAWEAFLEGARRYFVDHLDHLRREFGDEGIGIAAGAVLSYLADEHGVYLGRPAALATADEARGLDRDALGHALRQSGLATHMDGDEGSDDTVADAAERIADAYAAHKADDLASRLAARDAEEG